MPRATEISSTDGGGGVDKKKIVIGLVLIGLFIGVLLYMSDDPEPPPTPPPPPPPPSPPPPSTDRANIADRADPSEEQRQLTESLQNQLSAAESLESVAEQQLADMEDTDPGYEEALANYQAAQDAASSSRYDLEDVQESYICDQMSDGRNQYSDDRGRCRPCVSIPNAHEQSVINCTTGSDQIITEPFNNSQYCREKYYYLSPDDAGNSSGHGKCLPVMDTGNQPWGGSGEPCTTGRDYWGTMYTPTSPGDCRTCPANKYFNATNRTCSAFIMGNLNHPCGTGSPQNKCNAGFECNEQYVPGESVCKIALYNAGGGVCDVNADCIGQDQSWGSGLNRDCSSATTMSGDRCVD